MIKNESILKLNIKQKEKIMQDISKNYIRNLQHLVLTGSKVLDKITISDTNLPRLNLHTDFSSELTDEQKNVLCVNLSLNTLTESDAMIIYNDFIFPKGKKWWSNYYSPSSYYRNRNVAIDNFLEVFLPC